MANKVIELFSKSTQRELLEKTKEAYGFFIEKLHIEASEYQDICVRYARFVQDSTLNLDDFVSISVISTSMKILDGNYNTTGDRDR